MENTEPKYNNISLNDIIDNNFVYHAPKEDQPKRYELIRNTIKNAAKIISENCPSSRELSIAINKLDEAVMWANASIARNEK